MKTIKPRRVVITGAGTVSALGHDWQTVGDRLKTMTSAVRYMPDWEQFAGLKNLVAAPVDDFQLPGHYRARDKMSMGRVAQMGVLATERALRQAELYEDPRLASGRCGVAFGSTTGSAQAGEELFTLLRDQSMSQINSTTYIRHMSHTATVNIGVYFGLRGRVYTTTSACTSGSQGIGYAYEAIKLGLQDVMVAGGAEELCPAQAAIFDAIMSASRKFNQSPSATPRPFDTKRDGLVVGEGATTLILESLESALERGATILGEIVGFASNSDGAHLIRPQQDTQEAVMRDALESAELSAENVGYVSAHGTATDRGDVTETHATFNALGRLPISSLKSFTGHSLGACGAFEFWATLMMMNEGWFAPTLNLSEPDPRCADLDYIAGECRKIDTDMIMSNNFAFGGINTSLIGRRWSA